MAAHHRNRLKERQVRFVTMCITGMPAELKTDFARATACGWSKNQAQHVRDHPVVQQLFIEISTRLQNEAVDRIVDGVGAQVSTRQQALNRLWEIACMSKEEAGNTMHAQVQAVIKYLELTSGDGNTNGTTKGQLPRAAWMDKQQPN
jgi:hypothetical protein